MTYVYHFVPHNLNGTVLYPLNQLKDLHPEIYQSHVRKYKDREFLLRIEIPLLGCLWNDVLHFSPIHPEKIRDKMIELGQKWRSTRCFVVDAEAMNFTSSNTVYYFSGKTLKDRLFEPFEVEKLNTMRELPEVTLVYYAQMLKQGKSPLLFAHVPHILYYGDINLEGIDTINID